MRASARRSGEGAVSSSRRGAPHAGATRASPPTHRSIAPSARAAPRATRCSRPRGAPSRPYPQAAAASAASAASAVALRRHLQRDLQRELLRELLRDLPPGLDPGPCPPPKALTQTESQRGSRLSRPHDRPRRHPRGAAAPGVAAAPSVAQGGSSGEASWAAARKARLAAAAESRPPLPSSRAEHSRPERCPAAAARPRNSSTSSKSSAAASVAGERGIQQTAYGDRWLDRASGCALAPAAGSSCCR